MQDLIDNLSEAFKARDLGAARRLRTKAVNAADADLLCLWVSFEAILTRRTDEQTWHDVYVSMSKSEGTDLGPALDRSDALLATYDRVLARLDTAWTAYLLRAQEPAGE